MPPSPFEPKISTAGIASWLLLLIGLAPWFASEYPASLTENVSWLLIGAQRLLQQGYAINGFFGGDPPLNLMIDIPAILIGKLLHLTVWRAMFLWVAALVALAGLLVWRLTALVPGVNGARRQLITARLGQLHNPLSPYLGGAGTIHLPVSFSTNHSSGPDNPESPYSKT